MATTITADEFLASLNKWGVDWKFYRDKAAWLTLNRNAVQGFGPLRGVVAHNTAGTAQDSMIDYLARGDSARNLPGPLVQAGILKTGKVVLIGWGTANHSSAGDPKAEAMARGNALPLDREHTPTTTSADSSAVPIAPHYLGFEMCHGAEGPTAVQYRQAVLYTCACLDVMGGPAQGYGAGSMLMHRELTKNRSDPQGVPRDGKFRRDVAAALKAGPPVVTPPAPVAAPTVTTLTVNPTTTARGGWTKVSAVTNGAGTHVFEYLPPGATTWREFARRVTTSGRSELFWPFGATHGVRVRFVPAAPTKLRPSVSGTVKVTTVALPK
jgi:hypothetical protein